MKKIVILFGAGISAESGMDVHQIYIRARKHTLSLPEFYSEGAVILGFREAVSQHEWRTRICVRYRVTS